MNKTHVIKFEDRTKELWRYEADKVKNIMFGFERDPFSKYNAEVTPELCVLRVVNEKGVAVDWLIKNTEINGKRESEYLKEVILGYDKPFYLNSNQKGCHIKEDQHLSLPAVVYAFEQQIPIEEAKTLNVRTINKYPIMFKEDESKTMLVYDCTPENLLADNMLVAENSNVTVNCDVSTMFLSRHKNNMDGAILDNFYTELKHGLIHIFNVLLPNAKIHWSLYKNALKCDIRIKGRIMVAFSEIVWLYHNGKIDLNNPIQSIIKGHDELSAKGIVIDHLSERKSNNFIIMLAPVPSDVNSSFGARRSTIKRPYFFYIVYSPENNKVYVMAGIENGYIKKFVFSLEDHAIYNACFNEFADILKKAGYITKDRNENLFYYWSDPLKMEDEDNPLIKLSKMSADSFEDYRYGAFSDMPILAKQEG